MIGASDTDLNNRKPLVVKINAKGALILAVVA